MKITRDDKTWFYSAEWDDGRKAVLPSVTKVIDSAFGLYRGFDLEELAAIIRDEDQDEDRAARMARNASSMVERFRNAAAFGSNVHKATELYDNGLLDDDKLDPGLVHPLRAWFKFLDDIKPDLHEIEAKVASKLGFAGTADRVAEIGGKLAIIEIKSRPFQPVTDPLQTAAYAAAWQEMTGRKVMVRMVVTLNLNGTYTQHTNKDPRDFELFRCALALYNWRKTHGKN